MITITTLLVSLLYLRSVLQVLWLKPDRSVMLNHSRATGLLTGQTMRRLREISRFVCDVRVLRNGFCKFHSLKYMQ